jgi:cyclopropane-fatty-acyl-phospholipid synthase
MKNSKLKETVQDILSHADIKIDGDNPWDIKIHDDQFYQQVLAQGSLGLGESYMDGWWDCQKLDEFFFRILDAKLNEKVKPTFSTFLEFTKAKIFNKQSIKRSIKSVEKHYDFRIDLYMSFLDPYNQYTCGYFKETTNLNEAQEKKLDLICNKLQIKEGDKVLDIGCGWGGFAKFSSKKYGCHVTGIGISDEQIKYAKEYCKGLPVEIVKSDYRNFKGEFDKILICGMIEHVGSKNYRKIMEMVHSSLRQEGLFLLHTIGGNKSITNATDLWTDKYIFPNSMLPSAKQISSSAEGLYVVEDWHNFGAYYDNTLMAWYENFTSNWNKIEKYYDNRFFRMWNFYLLSCAGSFRARKNQLWQIVFSKDGVSGGYKSFR